MSTIENLRSALHPKILSLIILPTEKCNFRCTYCYETFEIGKMKRPTIDGIKKLIDARIQRQTIDRLSLAWFGGEPTLALEIIYEISEYAKHYHDEGKLKGMSGDLTTNGYLLNPETLSRLVALRQSTFQISLDGYGVGHDATRKYASGKGTFDTIWRNLLDAHKTDLDFKITLRLHQTEENDASMQKLVDEICIQLKGDRRFSIFFKMIENLGGPNSASISRMGLDKATQRVRKLAGQLQEAGFKASASLDGPESSKGDFEAIEKQSASVVPSEAISTLGPPAQAAAGFGGYICYASKPNSLLIRADGRVGKCTVFLDDARNTIGQLNADGTVTIDNALLKIWTRGFSSLDPLELGCPAMNLPKVDVLTAIERPIKLHRLEQRAAAVIS